MNPLAMNLGQMFGGGGMRGRGEDPNAKKSDTSEQIVISSLALLKMLKHGSDLVTRSCRSSSRGYGPYAG